MTTRRIIAGALAVVLALVGGAIIFAWSSGADRRALAELEPVQVLVAVEPIPEGTSAVDAAELVTLQEIPGTAAVPDALTSLDDVKDMVVTAELAPGEQVLRHRFAPAAEAASASKVEVPQGMHEISVQLEPRRLIGGHLQPGDTVAVFMSFTIEEVQQTKLVLSKALVTNVRGGVRPIATDTAEALPATDSETPPEAAPETAPADQVMVTFALSAADAEKLVFGSEWGSLWLSKEPADATLDGTRILHGGNIYQ